MAESNTDVLDFAKAYAKLTDEEKNISYCQNWLAMLRNANNFSYWFPKIVGLREKGIYVPRSYISFVPEEVYLSFFMDHAGDRECVVNWVKRRLMPAIEKYFTEQDIFIKNGCFSNKFNFNKNCHIFQKDNAFDIAEKIINIMYDGLCLDTDGFTEVVMREWIEPEPGTKTIYNGMPFRPEMRVFYDFDQKNVLYTVNYWDWDYCHDHICERNADDAAVYESEYKRENELVEALGKKYLPLIQDALSSVRMLGKWSVDFILEKDRIILIDMAVAHRSAYYDQKKIANEE